jgi:hypothetical protein
MAARSKRVEACHPTGQGFTPWPGGPARAHPIAEEKDHVQGGLVMSFVIAVLVVVILVVVIMRIT